MQRTSRDKFLHAKSVHIYHNLPPSTQTHADDPPPFLFHSFHIVLSREYCEAPENRAAVERLAHESDATCAWAAVLDVHVFADSTFDWSVTDSLLSRLHTVDPSPISSAQPDLPCASRGACRHAVRPRVLLGVPPAPRELRAQRCSTVSAVWCHCASCCVPPRAPPHAAAAHARRPPHPRPRPPSTRMHGRLPCASC